MDILNEHDIPCGPILSMKEVAEEPSLRDRHIVEVDHPTRGKYLTVGNPIKMSDSPSDVKRSPLLGEHTDEVLQNSAGTNEIAALRAEKSHLKTALGTTMITNLTEVTRVLDTVKAEGRTALTAPEGKLVCEAHGSPFPRKAWRRRPPTRRRSQRRWAFRWCSRSSRRRFCTRPRREACWLA